MAIATYNAKYGQSIYDICNQCYGTLNLLYKLIQDNNISNTNTDDFTGKKFIFDTSLIRQRSVIERDLSNEKFYITKSQIDENGILYNDVELVAYSDPTTYLIWL